MPYCRTGHLRIYYQHIGHRGPLILLLHGWGHNWEAWSSIIPSLSQAYQLLIPDLPGFGLSDSPPQGWNMAQYGEWLRVFLRERNVTTIHAVIGHSFGAKIAGFAWLAYASTLNLPAVTKGLGLISASGVPNDLVWWRRLLRTGLGFIPIHIKRRLGGAGRKILYENILHEYDYLSATPFQEDTLRLILPADIRRLVTQRRSVPLHIAWGQLDQEVPLWMAYEWVSLSTAADVFVIPGADHYLPHKHATQLQQWWSTWL